MQYRQATWAIVSFRDSWARSLQQKFDIMGIEMWA